MSSTQLTVVDAYYRILSRLVDLLSEDEACRSTFSISVISTVSDVVVGDVVVGEICLASRCSSA